MPVTHPGKVTKKGSQQSGAYYKLVALAAQVSFTSNSALGRLVSVLEKMAASGAKASSVTIKNGVATISGTYTEGVGLPFGIGVGQIGPSGPFTITYNLKTGKTATVTNPGTDFASNIEKNIGAGIGGALGGVGTAVAGGLVSGFTGFFTGLEPAFANYIRANLWIVLIGAITVVVLLGAGMKLFSGGAVPVPVPV